MSNEAPKRIWLCPQNYEAATACCHPSDTEYVRADLVNAYSLGEWQDIETAPADGKFILVYVPHNKCIFEVSRFPNEWWRFAGAGSDAFLPSHWQPSKWMSMPAPPVQGESENE